MDNLHFDPPPLVPITQHPEPDQQQQDEEQGEKEEPRSKRAQLGAFMKSNLTSSHALALKSKLYLQQTLGLGSRPNAIPPGEASVKGDMRVVEIGWHPVAGFGGKWFAEQTRLGLAITKRIGGYPDPTQHWGVLVGGFVHQLWMDEHLHVIYINEPTLRSQWHTFEVGATRFSDEALRQTGEMVIHNMRTLKPSYNLISNNCQNFATNLLDSIQIGAHREFATSFAVYQRATGEGAIMDLFSAPPEEGKEHAQDPAGMHAATMEYAGVVMDEQTTKLDEHGHG